MPREIDGPILRPESRIDLWFRIVTHLIEVFGAGDPVRQVGPAEHWEFGIEGLRVEEWDQPVLRVGLETERPERT